ncbi:helix-turn-helix domain-containing protein [Clostridia bacterium OttesenSCG-928-F22]|nr:helix-turn-helix domain-containing protein [Clostridia bacterium OttesenSCG-928-F22]
MYFQRLEDLRIDCDKTQQEIADILNCKREVYRRYEKGIHEIPVWAVIQLAEYYKTSTDYILGLTDNKKRYEPKNKDQL